MTAAASLLACLIFLFIIRPSQQENILDDNNNFDSFGLPLFRTPRHVALVVAVLSAPRDVAERQACRDTWFQLRPDGLQSDDVLFLFLIGASGDDVVDAAVRDELRRYHDILLLPMSESYRRLVYKTAAVYDYVAQRRDLTFDFLLKTDDDSFVRLDRLIPLLRNVREPNVYWGAQNTNVKRHFDAAHKWHDALWLEPKYPPYALGSAYALSSDLVRKLGSLSIDARPMFPVEDAATGIWLRNAVGESHLRRVHADPLQFPLIATGDGQGVCHPQMIVRRHCHGAERMQRLYANLRSCGDLCCGATSL
jgi:hypothetical protein